MSGKKYFVLMENGEDTSQVFVNSQPRGAALTECTVSKAGGLSNPKAPAVQLTFQIRSGRPMSRRPELSVFRVKEVRTN